MKRAERSAALLRASEASSPLDIEVMAFSAAVAEEAADAPSLHDLDIDLSQEDHAYLEKLLDSLHCGAILETIERLDQAPDHLLHYFATGEFITQYVPAVAHGLQILANQLSYEDFQGATEYLVQMLQKVPTVSFRCIEALLTQALATTLSIAKVAPFQKALLLYVHKDDGFRAPTAPSLHSIAIDRVFRDIRSGRFSNYRRFMRSPFVVGNPFPARAAREAAREGWSAGLRLFQADPTELRLDSLTMIGAISDISAITCWRDIMPLVATLEHSGRSALAVRIVDTFFPVNLRGSSQNDDYLKSELIQLALVNQQIATRARRHYTAYSDYSLNHLHSHLVPPIQPTLLGLPTGLRQQDLKAALDNACIPARFPGDRNDAVEILPSQATVLGRLTAQLYARLDGIRVMMSDEINCPVEYDLVAHAIVLNFSEIAEKRRISGDPYRLLHQGVLLYEARQEVYRSTGSPLSVQVMAASPLVDDHFDPLFSFVDLSSALADARWHAKRVQHTLRRIEIPLSNEDERDVSRFHLTRVKERFLAAEGYFHSILDLVEQIIFAIESQSLRAHYGEDELYPGIISARITVTHQQAPLRVVVPLPTSIGGCDERNETLLRERLEAVEDVAEHEFRSSAGYISNLLERFRLPMPIIELVNSSSKRRQRTRTLKSIKLRSRQILQGAAAAVVEIVRRSPVRQTQ